MAMTEREKFDVVKGVIDGKEWQHLAGHQLWVNGEGLEELLGTIVGGWQVRLKPKSDVVFHFFAKNDDDDLVELIESKGFHNLRLTFDGETGNLKSAEVVNQ